jgi:hypothetical protein
MLTSIEVNNANCSFCFNEARAALLQSPAVHTVTVDASHGCFQIDHDYPDVTPILAILDLKLKAWTVAGNGEVEMVPSSASVIDQCTHQEINR